MQGPVVEQLSEELDGKVSFFKVDVDENQATAEKFGVMSIPMLVVIKNGEIVSKAVGARPKQDILAML